jgi:hypothetical protein
MFGFSSTLKVAGVIRDDNGRHLKHAFSGAVHQCSSNSREPENDVPENHNEGRRYWKV